MIYILFSAGCKIQCVYSLCMCGHKILLSDIFPQYVLCLRQNEQSWNHLHAACSDKQIRFQIMNICVKAIALCWYYNIQMLIGFTLQSISKEKQQKLTKGLPVHFQAV